MWRKPCQASPVVHFHLQHWLASVHLRLSWELPVVLYGTRGKPTTLLQTNIAMESGPLIHSKWLHYQRLSTVPKTGSLSLAQGIEGSKNRPTISESSWGLYFKIAIIHWLAKTEPLKRLHCLQTQGHLSPLLRQPLQRFRRCQGSDQGVSLALQALVSSVLMASTIRNGGITVENTMENTWKILGNY